MPEQSVTAPMGEKCLVAGFNMWEEAHPALPPVWLIVMISRTIGHLREVAPSRLSAEGVYRIALKLALQQKLECSAGLAQLATSGSKLAITTNWVKNNFPTYFSNFFLSLPEK